MLTPFDRIKTPKDFTVGATKYNAIQQNGMYQEWLIDTGREPPKILIINFLCKWASSPNLLTRVGTHNKQE